MSFVNFAELKEKVPVEQAIPLLNLQLKQHGTQWRGACPICKSGGNRALVVTQGKGFYCFGGKTGGDVIGLVSHIKGVTAKDAALFIAQSLSQSPQERNNGKDHGNRTIHPLSHLEPGHENILKLGLSKETAEHIGAGYTGKGIMRGRVAVPIHDAEGGLIAYCGLGDELHFPSGFEPSGHIFNWHRMEPGEVYLVSNPLQVLTSFESGVENVVAILTTTLSPSQLRLLASLMDDKECVAVL